MQQHPGRVDDGLQQRTPEGDGTVGGRRRSPAAIASLARSTQIACGSPLEAIERANESTLGGRGAAAVVIAVERRLRRRCCPFRSSDSTPNCPCRRTRIRGTPASTSAPDRRDGPCGWWPDARPDRDRDRHPGGYAGFVLPRSGMALNHGLTVVNAPGLIDAAYRGEIKVILLNTDPEHDVEIHRGDRIAQLVIQQVEEVGWHASARSTVRTAAAASAIPAAPDPPIHHLRLCFAATYAVATSTNADVSGASARRRPAARTRAPWPRDGRRAPPSGTAPARRRWERG